MISVIESHSNIVASYEVKRYRQYGDAHEFVAVVHFIDDSSLHIRDDVFTDGERKYLFHWQDSKQQLILRWDNSAHYTQIATFPFHQHTSTAIKESAPMNIQKVLEYIEGKLKKNDNDT